MKLLNIKTRYNNLPPLTATIGFFDGVHRGHQFLINKFRIEAKRRGQQSMIITFKNHPRLLFDPHCGLHQLTLAEERSSLIESTGVDYTLMIDFDYNFSRLTSLDFLNLLKTNFNVATLIVGYDHHFGCDKENGFEYYNKVGKEIGIEVIKEDTYIDSNISVSSTKIRNELEKGSISLANKYLGYNYFMEGIVTEGNKIGRTIDYPTANIVPNSLKLIPSDGVYATYTIVDSIKYKSMTNIGTRPTVDGQNRTIETHIFGFKNEIYGKEITIQFVDKIREEQRFADITQLKQQISEDKNKVIDILIHCSTDN